MPDSLPLISSITDLVEALPTVGVGHRVEDAAQFAVDIIGIVAPAYQQDIDSFESQAVQAQSLADQRNAELLLLRGEADQLREVIAGLKAAASNDDMASINALLSTV